jgi:co-chaperonin GroES (HSP10)
VKSKPELQSRISGSPSVQQPKAEIRGKRSTKSSSRSSKTSSSSNNISPASSYPRKQAVAKASKGDNSTAKNSVPLVKQKPFLLRASFPPRMIPEGVPVIGGPLHMKYNFQPKSITISALSKEEKAKNVIRKANEELLKEEKKSVEPEVIAVSEDPETSNNQNEKRKSNDGNNILGKKGKNKKANKRTFQVSSIIQPLPASVNTRVQVVQLPRDPVR